MSESVFRYSLRRVPRAGAEETLVLSLLAVEALHGEAGARLGAAHYLDRRGRACVIDATTRVGRDLNRLFVGFLRHAFGADAFRVERIWSSTSRQQAHALPGGPPARSTRQKHIDHAKRRGGQS